MSELFVNPEDRFSRDTANIIVHLCVPVYDNYDVSEGAASHKPERSGR